MRVNESEHASVSIKRFPVISRYNIPVKNTNGIAVLQALDYIFHNVDPSIAYRRYCCGGQYCNSCLMKINGVAKHACKTVIRPGDTVLIEPLAGHRVIRDLVTDIDDCSND
jgi:succinate dehydrogenase/fumarate reductase-like Fe-S protein